MKNEQIKVNEMMEEQLIDSIEKVLSIENLRNYLKKNDDLGALGINSIKFIQLVVEIEGMFNFEFEDEDLAFGNFNSYKTLRDYVFNKVESQVHHEKRF